MHQSWLNKLKGACIAKDQFIWRAALKIGIPAARLSKILSGDRRPTPSDLLRLAAYLETPIEKIFPP